MSVSSSISLLIFLNILLVAAGIAFCLGLWKDKKNEIGNVVAFIVGAILFLAVVIGSDFYFANPEWIASFEIRGVLITVPILLFFIYLGSVSYYYLKYSTKEPLPEVKKEEGK